MNFAARFRSLSSFAMTKWLENWKATRSFATAPSMCFAVAGRDVWSVDFFLRDDRVLLRRHRLKFSWIFACQGNGHKLHPDGQRGAASSFLLSEGLFFVVAYPHATGERWRKTYKPGIGEIVSRSRLAGQRIRHPGGSDRGAVEHHLP